MSTYNSNFSEEQLNKIFAAVNTSVFRSSGAGGFHNSIQNILVNFDRFGYNPVPLYSEHSGVTFITRPKLNFTPESLKQSRVLSTLNTVDESTVQFAIRCLLDTKYSKDYSALSYNCPHFNVFNPFFTPLCNCLTSISGFPDLNMDTEQTTGGYHSEDLTYAIGSDRLNRTYELGLNFRDIHGGVIMAIFQYWHEYMSLLAKGEVVSYGEDIDDVVIPYTVSIYRFLLDPSRKYVTKWAKATGCFPKSVPLGACFNINEGEVFNSSSARFGIPFVANKIEYDDYAIFLDFNTLVKRYCPNIDDMPSAPITAEYNFTQKAVPYISTTGAGIELQYRYNTSDLDQPFESTVEEITQQARDSQNSTLMTLNTATQTPDEYWVV